MHLNPYKNRGWHTVEIRERWGRRKIYKIPHELTVEELERLLELNTKIERLSLEQVDDADFDAQEAGVKRFWNYLFAQVTIIFQHFHPDVTEEYLRKHLSDAVALEITNFFDNNRYYKSEANATESKKKVTASDQLVSIRRTLVFMTRQGFGLLELKKLYVDELFSYYNELVYSLEKSKELPEGSYDKVRGIDRSGEKLNAFFGALNTS
jgi:hypothetical protein